MCFINYYVCFRQMVWIEAGVVLAPGRGETGVLLSVPGQPR